MAEQYCEPYEQCTDLDGRLLIARTISGPALAMEEGQLPFGSMELEGGSLHPYARIAYNQQLTPLEACYGPVRSVFGLAPGEKVTTEMRYREQVDVVQMVQHAMESSEVTTTTRRQGRETTEANTVEMAPLSISVFGSFLEDLGDAVGGVVSGAGDLATGTVGGVASLIDSILGGGGGGGGPQPHTVHEEVVTTVNETLDSVQRSESNSTLTETTTSRSRQIERSITRTFSNPYWDRSLELRFIPVFRRFKVVTTLVRVDVGVVLKAGHVRFPELGIGAKFGHFLQQRVADPRIASVAVADLGLDDEVASRGRTSAVSDHLKANATLYTKRFMTHTQLQRDNDMIRQPVARLIQGRSQKPESAARLLNALSWSKARVSDNHVQVPFAEASNALTALKLPPAARERFEKGIKRITDPNVLSTYTVERDVHVFMGTHIEPVAGTCVLENLPEIGDDD